MTKAFFYDTLCGMVYRCMFAGLDEYGHAQWVSITPGEESKTYLLSLEVTAKIPVITKDLRISDKLKQEVKKNDLGMFTCIMKEHEYVLNKEEE